MFSQVHPAYSLLKIPKCGSFSNYDIPVMTCNPNLGTSRSGNVSKSEKLADISIISGVVTIITSQTGFV